MSYTTSFLHPADLWKKDSKAQQLSPEDYRRLVVNQEPVGLGNNEVLVLLGGRSDPRPQAINAVPYSITADGEYLRG